MMIDLNLLLNILFNVSGPGMMIGRSVLTLILLLVIILLCSHYLQHSMNIRTAHHADQLRSDFYTKVSYEFRTPPTIILGLTRQLQEQRDLHNHNASTYLSAIERQGRNLSNLVNQLLDVAGLNSYDKPNEWKRG